MAWGSVEASEPAGDIVKDEGVRDGEPACYAPGFYVDKLGNWGCDAIAYGTCVPPARLVNLLIYESCAAPQKLFKLRAET